MFIINNFKSGFNLRVLIGVGRLSSGNSNAIFWHDKSQNLRQFLPYSKTLISRQFCNEGEFIVFQTQEIFANCTAANT